MASAWAGTAAATELMVMPDRLAGGVAASGRGSAMGKEFEVDAR